MQKLTMEQAVVVSAYTGFLVCPFDQMHAEIEKRLGRPVWTHEMGSEKFVDEQVRPAFEADFVAMLPDNAHALAEARSDDSQRPGAAGGTYAL